MHMCTRIHTGTHTQLHYRQFITYLNQQKSGTCGGGRQLEVVNVAGVLFWEKKCLQVRFGGVQRGFLSERKAKVIPCRRAKDRKSCRNQQREKRVVLFCRLASNVIMQICWQCIQRHPQCLQDALLPFCASLQSSQLFQRHCFGCVKHFAGNSFTTNVCIQILCTKITEIVWKVITLI